MKKVSDLINIAETELESLKGYERADIALRLANILLITNGLETAEKTVPTRESLENKPTPKKAEAEKPAALTDLNPAAPIADKIQEAMTKAPAEKSEQEAPVQQEEPAPAPVAEPTPAPAEEKAEIDIASDAWKKKILTPQEIDDDWTPAMQANEELVTALGRLKEFVKRGMAAKVLTQDWLNSELSKVTNGHITDFADKRALSPKFIKVISPYIIKKGIELANAKKASQAA